MCLSTTPRQLWGAPNLLRNVYRAPIPPGIKRKWREANHSSSSSAEVKKNGAILHSPHTSSGRSAYVNPGGNFSHEMNSWVLKNGVFWVVTPCGSCKNRRSVPHTQVKYGLVHNAGFGGPLWDIDGRSRRLGSVFSGSHTQRT
jgi:hypothetical protein